MSNLLELADEDVRWESTPNVILQGVDHDPYDLARAYQEYVDSSYSHYRYAWVDEGMWGWTPRLKWCENHFQWFGCGDNGEWHKHFAKGYGEPRTVLQPLAVVPELGYDGEKILDTHFGVWVERKDKTC